MKAFALFVSAFLLINCSQAQNFVRFLTKYEKEVADIYQTDFKYFELVQGKGSVVLIHRFLKDSTKVFEKTVFFDSLGNEIGMNKKEFFESRKIKSVERVDGLLNERSTKTYHENGTLKSEVLFRDGEVLSEDYYNEYGEEMPKPHFSPATPREGMEGWNRYLASNLKYPVEARRGGQQGMVIIVFTLDKEGVIGDPQVFNRGECHESLEKEALRIFIEYPYRWSPAIEYGVAVESEVRLPVRFKLS